MSKFVIETAADNLVALGYEVQNIEATDEVPSDQLMVLLPDDSEGRPRQLFYSMFPDLSENLEDADLLQAFIKLPFVVERQAVANLARLLVNINNKLALGEFSIRESDGLVFYRNVALMPHGSDVDEAWRKIVTENVFIAVFQLDEFTSVIEMVATGDMSLEQAQKMDQRLDPFV
ncbi:MAG: hypothetical protein IIC27_00505 [Chloroflexi bacterium]|nr:hypothetical protein [Chloroflexota bacterium]